MLENGFVDEAWAVPLKVLGEDLALGEVDGVSLGGDDHAAHFLI